MSLSAMVDGQRIEEETIRHYETLRYYPVHIGQTFQERYTVAAKLGFGGNATVWLCQDIRENSYKTLKVGVCRKSKDRESEVLKYLRDMNSSHNGRYCVRRATDSFAIIVPDGSHHCLVYDPLGMSLLEHVRRQEKGTLKMQPVKWITTYLLQALDYLHTCGVVHTDIKLDNIQSTLPDDENFILSSIVDAERKQPGFRKQVNDTTTIYTSRCLDYGDLFNYPILGDLGSAVFNQSHYEGVVQAIPYRAPEVMLRMKWTSSVDIWNLGVLIWELLFAEHLFGNSHEEDSFALMITYLGLPTAEFLRRSEIHLEYFDEAGVWKGRTIQPVNLMDRLEDGTDLETFLDFMRSMLQWVPEERKTATELLSHPWLQLE